MEGWVDISQDRGPLLFWCCQCCRPPPTLTGLEFYSPMPLFSLVFLFSPPHSLTQLRPLLLSAFVKDSPSTTPLSLSLPPPPSPLSLFLSYTHYLTRSLIMCSSVPLTEGWERSALEGSAWEISDTPLVFSSSSERSEWQERICPLHFHLLCLSVCNTTSLRAVSLSYLPLQPAECADTGTTTCCLED